MSIKTFLQYQPHNDLIEGLVDHGRGATDPEFASQALTFMVCGVFEKWKQAVGYVLSNAATPALTLHELLKTCLSKLVEAGLKPKVLICDQGTINQSLYNSYLKVSADKPFFEFEGHEIITMFDSQYLVKLVRNMLLSKVSH